MALQHRFLKILEKMSFSFQFWSLTYENKWWKEVLRFLVIYPTATII